MKVLRWIDGNMVRVENKDEEKKNPSKNTLSNWDYVFAQPSM